jgi:Outer membrane protein beta-barrel domain
MSSVRWFCLKHSFPVVGAAILLTAGAAYAQSNPEPAAQQASGESSSQSYQFLADDLNAAVATAAEPSGSGQYDNRGSHRGTFSHWAFEAGAGFSAPVGNAIPYITWGGNLTVGAGLHFPHGFTLLGEYQFMDNKLPGAFVAAGGGTGGDAHINSLTVAPVLELFPKTKFGTYLTGGGGWYHKSTNFFVTVCCDFYGYPVNITTNSFSSDQWGGSIGLGFTYRLGDLYGDSQTKFFAEARYLFINTPPITETNGLGTTGLIPVTIGLRF